MKDNKWLRNEVRRLCEEDFHSDYSRYSEEQEELPSDYVQGLEDMKKRVLEFIFEMDDVGKLLDEAYDSGYKTGKIHVENKEKTPGVTVPGFVADWFESNKDNLDYNIRSLLSKNEFPRIGWSEMKHWVNSPHNRPFQTLVLMFNGYEVAEDTFEVRDKQGNILLFKVTDESTNKNRVGQIVKQLNVGESGSTFLTKEEIESYDKTYLGFIDNN